MTEAWLYVSRVLEEFHLIVNLCATTACVIALIRVLAIMLRVGGKIENMEDIPPENKMAARASLKNAKRSARIIKGSFFAVVLFCGGMLHWVFAGLPGSVSAQQSTMWGAAVTAMMIVVYQMGGVMADIIDEEGRPRSSAECESECSS